MDAKVGDAIVLEASFVDSDGDAITDLTVTGYLYDESGNLTLNGVTASNLGGGPLYRHTSGSTYDAGGVWGGWWVATGGSATPKDPTVSFEIRVEADYTAARAAKLDYLDQAISDVAQAVWDVLTSALTTASSVGAYLLQQLGLITSGAVSVNSPVTGSTSAVSIVRGDEYDPADGATRTIGWTLDSAWPKDLTTADSLTVTVYDGSGRVNWTHGVEATSTSAFRCTKVTSAESATLEPGEKAYDVQAVWGTVKHTLARGTWTTLRDYSS